MKQKISKNKLNGEPRKEIDTLGRPANGGCPPKDIDEEEVYKLAKLWCTQEEIAAHLNCSVDTLDRRFAEIIKKGKEDGKASLRRMQWRSAADGNVTMQIWLGKTILKQKEEVNTDIGPKEIILRGSLPDASSN